MGLKEHTKVGLTEHPQVGRWACYSRRQNCAAAGRRLRANRGQAAERAVHCINPIASTQPLQALAELCGGDRAKYSRLLAALVRRSRVLWLLWLSSTIAHLPPRPALLSCQLLHLPAGLLACPPAHGLACPPAHGCCRCHLPTKSLHPCVHTVFTGACGHGQGLQRLLSLAARHQPPATSRSHQPLVGRISRRPVK